MLTSNPVTPTSLFGFTSEMLIAANKATLKRQKLQMTVERNALFVPEVTVPSQSPLRLKGHMYSGGVISRDTGKVVEPAQLRRDQADLFGGYEDEAQAGSEPDLKLDRAVYGGIMFAHYGHFLLESLARVWGLVGARHPGPILFHGDEISRLGPSQVAILTLAGIDWERIQTPKEPVLVDSLAVPEAGFELQRTVSTEFIKFCERLAHKQEADYRPCENTYISRVGNERGETAGEGELEELLVGNGFRARHLEDYEFLDQVRILEESHHIVGLTGSALHNVIFVRNRPQMTYIVRDAKGIVDYFAIDRAKAFRSAFINADAAYMQKWGASGPFLVDVEFAYSCLKRLGTLKSKVPVSRATRYEDLAKLQYLKSKLGAKGKEDELAAIAQHVSQALPDRVDAQTLSALALMRAGRNEEAEAVARNAVKLKPKDAQLHRQLSGILLLLGKVDEALETAKQALEIAPDDKLIKAQFDRAQVAVKRKPPVSASTSMSTGQDGAAAGQ